MTAERSSAAGKLTRQRSQRQSTAASKARQGGRSPRVVGEDVAVPREGMVDARLSALLRISEQHSPDSPRTSVRITGMKAPEPTRSRAPARLRLSWYWIRMLLKMSRPWVVLQVGAVCIGNCPGTCAATHAALARVGSRWGSGGSHRAGGGARGAARRLDLGV